MPCESTILNRKISRRQFLQRRQFPPRPGQWGKVWCGDVWCGVVCLFDAGLVVANADPCPCPCHSSSSLPSTCIHSIPCLFTRFPWPFHPLFPWTGRLGVCFESTLKDSFAFSAPLCLLCSLPQFLSAGSTDKAIESGR